VRNIIIRNTMLGLLVLFFLTGCEPTKVEYRPVGELVSIRVIPTSFNEPIKSMVLTTKGFFVVKGHISGLKGEDVVLQSKTNWASAYLFIGDRQKNNRVLGF